MEIAYHAAHEQFPPSELLRYAVMAENAGFDAIHSSDHFHPWSVRQGNSGFTFSWIAAAMQVTSIPFSMVCAPGQRYHPAIVAQAIATLAEMFPGRFDIELGSGEALNESITGEEWPAKNIRNERLLECVNIIRRLLRGEEVTHEGLVQVKEAKLFTLPRVVPHVFGAAVSEKTARWCGEWADGLITISGSEKEIKSKIDAFRNHAPDKPVYVQHSFSFALNKNEAAEAAYHQWRSNMVPRNELADLYKTEQFDKEGEHITREEVEQKVILAGSITEVMESFSFMKELGVARVILHNINRNHEEFIESYANEV